jgi:hypothetical protein
VTVGPSARLKHGCNCTSFHGDPLTSTASFDPGGISPPEPTTPKTLVEERQFCTNSWSEETGQVTILVRHPLLLS